MEKEKILVKQLVLEMDEEKYVNLVEKVSSELIIPKYKKNQMLKKIYEGKLNQIFKNNSSLSGDDEKLLGLLKETISLIDDYKDKNKVLKNENQILTKNNNSLKEEINQLKISCLKIKEEKNLEISSIKKGLEEENSKLKNEILFLNEEIKNLKIQTDDLFNKILKKEKINSEIKIEFNSVKNLLNEKNKELFNLKNGFNLLFENSLNFFKNHFNILSINNFLNPPQSLKINELTYEKQKIKKNIDEDEDENKTISKNIFEKKMISDSFIILQSISNLEKSNKFLYIICNNKNFLNFLEKPEIIKIMMLNKNFYLITHQNNYWIKRMCDLQIEDKIEKEESLKRKLNYFKSESGKINQTLKKYYIYKNLYKRELNCNIDKFQIDLTSVCERIIEETLDLEKDEPKEIEENLKKDNFSFFNKLKSTFAKLNDQGIVF